MANAGIEKNTFRGGGLSRINMGAYANITVAFNRSLASHNNPPLGKMSFAGDECCSQLSGGKVEMLH
jgi:hypothetical protein